DLDLMSNSLLSLRLKNLFGTSSLSGFNMASKISFVPNNLGSGQGWHRDVAVSYQFKAILYLSDVDTHSGPFQYYNKSGNCLAMLNLERKEKLPVAQNRFTEKEAKLFDQRCITEICAPAGTLILANTRGIHRGKPISSGNRYALTSYQWPHAIPNHIQPYVN
ncbi:MAG: hypothetical protein ABJ340_04865, partial [Paraglaciecola sp.]|uniref:hypothetical protein n=1 Tax=Paraglaciecola sp. TaxID=1920173 RepID=UPI003297EB02